MKAASECCCILLFLLPSALFKLSKGQSFHISLWAAPPILDGAVRANHDVNFTCQMFNVDHTYQYQWSFGEEAPWIGNAVESRNFSDLRLGTSLKITCAINAQVNDRNVSGSISVVVSIGQQPDIKLGYYNKTPHEGTDMNITATIRSSLPIISLQWAVSNGDLPASAKNHTSYDDEYTYNTLSLFTLTHSDSGNYTFTARNSDGESTVVAYIDVGYEPPPPCHIPGFINSLPNHINTVVGQTTSVTCLFRAILWNFGLYSSWNVTFPSSQHTKALSIHDNSTDLYYLAVYQIDFINCTFNNKLIIHNVSRELDGANLTCIESDNEHGINPLFEQTATTNVVPSPKVIEPPHNLSTTVGSTAVFTCDFEAATDNRISQIHWMFNGNDLAGCKRFQDRINCMVTQNSTDANYISSTLEIYSVQADNAGQYTCYCSYDTNALNVDGVQVIQSDQKSATLSVQSDSSPENSKVFIIIGIFVGFLILIIIVMIVVIYCVRVHYKNRHRDYEALPGRDEPLEEITDEMLDKYIIEELFPFWEKLGKALKLPGCFLEDTYNDFPEDPAERLKVILREWRATSDYPSIYVLNKKLEQIGFKNIIPQ